MYTYRRVISSIGTIVFFVVLDCSIRGFSAEIPESAIAAWKELDNATSVTSLDRTSVLPSAKGPRTRRDRLAVQGELQKLETESRVWLKAKDAFYVLRKNSAGDWQMEQAHGLESEFSELVEFRKKAFSIVDFCLLDALKDKNFAFSNWRESDSDHFEFEVTNLEEARLNRLGVGHRPAPFENVTIRVDATNHFRIVEFHHRPSQGGVTAFVKTNYEYQEDPFFPTAIKQTSTIEGKEPIEWSWTYTSISHSELPQSEFSLEHYGLVSPGTSPFGGWIRILFAAVFLLLVGFFSVRFIRK